MPDLRLNGPVGGQEALSAPMTEGMDTRITVIRTAHDTTKAIMATGVSVAEAMASAGLKATDLHLLGAEAIPMAMAHLTGITKGDKIADALNAVLRVDANFWNDVIAAIPEWNISGDVALAYITPYENLRTLPKRLLIDGNLSAPYVGFSRRDCELTVLGSMHIRCCDHLEHLPDKLHVDVDLTVESCKPLRSLPGDLSVGRDFHIMGCHEWDGKIPYGTQIGRYVQTDNHLSGLFLNVWRSKYPDGEKG